MVTYLWNVEFCYVFFFSYFLPLFCNTLKPLTNRYVLLDIFCDINNYFSLSFTKRCYGLSTKFFYRYFGVLIIFPLVAIEII